MDYNGKRSVRSYLVFTPFAYRIAVFLLIPAGLTAFGIWAVFFIGDIGLILMSLLLPLAEILSDSWIFGGIQGKDREKMDYLKTSAQGMSVMRRALAVDLFRKFLLAIGTISVCGLAAGLVRDGVGEMNAAEGINWTDFLRDGGVSREIGFGLYLILLSYFISVLGTFLSRYGSSISVNMVVSYAAIVLMIVGIFGLGMRGYLAEGIFLLDALLAALGTGISVLAVRTAMKKAEGGYYEE